MVTTQTAFNSFDRVVRYVEQIKDETNLYKKSKEHLADLREIALSLIEAIDNKIGEVSEEVEIKRDDTKEMMIEILSLLKKENVEIKSETNDEVISKPQVKDRVSNTIVKDYKTAVATILDNEDTEFTTNARDCMEWFSYYLNTRFNLNNDPHKIHFFDKKEFRNYAAAFVINFADKIYTDNVDDFIYRLRGWFNDVESGTVKYTLPKDIASIFFDIKNGNDLDIPEEVEFIARDIWNESWVFGLSSVYDNSIYSPDYDMEWIFGSRLELEFDDKIDVNYFDDVKKKDLDKLKKAWIGYYHISKRNSYIEHIDKLKYELDYESNIPGLQDTNIISPELSLNIIVNRIESGVSVKDITKILNRFIRSCKCFKPNYSEIDEMIVDYCLTEYN